MAKYLILASYSDTAVAGMLQHPADRALAVNTLVEAAGGTMESFHWMLGPYDAAVIVRLPDANAMASLALSVIASHALKGFESYELISHEDIPKIEEAARTYARSYRPPGQED